MSVQTGIIMNANHNSLQRQLFLENYAEIIPVVLSLRENGYSMPEIAAELNSRGFLTREKKPFSHVQVLRILRRVGDGNLTQAVSSDSSQNEVIKSQVQDELATLKNEICTLKQRYDELQVKLSEIESQLAELKKENQSQSKSIRHFAGSSMRSKDDVLEWAHGIHAENPTLSKSEVARQIAQKTGVKSETVRHKLKKMW